MAETPPRRFAAAHPDYAMTRAVDAFRKSIIQLDAGERPSSPVQRSFTSIPIVFRGAIADGLGDVQQAIKLAKAMQRFFPDKAVVIYFPTTTYYPIDLERWRASHAEDYLVDATSTQKLYGRLSVLWDSFDPQQSENVVDGIRILRKPASEISEIVKQQLISIHLHLLDDVGVVDRKFLSGSLINLYLTEYDHEDAVEYPPDMVPKLAYRYEGNLHLFVPTGFGSGSAGIHLEPRTVISDPITERRALLSRLFGSDYPASADAEALIAAKWAVGYYHAKQAGRFDTTEHNGQTWGDRYEELLRRGMVDPYVLFDFAGEAEEIATPGLCARNRVGLQSPELFHRFMQQADLPVVVTGDASLAEAISSAKVFIYQRQVHKIDMCVQLSKFAEAHLTPADFAEFEGYYSTKFFNDQVGLRLLQEPAKLAFQRFSEVVREHLDLYRNLAQLIRDGLAVLGL